MLVEVAGLLLANGHTVLRRYDDAPVLARLTDLSAPHVGHPGPDLDSAPARDGFLSSRYPVVGMALHIHNGIALLTGSPVARRLSEPARITLRLLAL